MSILEKLNLKKIMATSLVSLVASASFANDVGVTPYLHPRPCDTLFDTRGVELLRSKNCETLFIKPKSIEKPHHIVDLEGSAQLCDAHNSLLRTLTKRTTNFELAENKAAEALEQGNDAGYEKWGKIADLAEDRVISTQGKYSKFSSIHSSTMQSLFNNVVTGDDIDSFVTNNRYVFANMEKAPNVEAIKTENSIYSFTHYRPRVAGEAARSIISTTIPGIEILAQPTAKQTNVAHVYNEGSLSGQTFLSLMGTCPMLEKKDEAWTMKRGGVREVLTVNRTYETPIKASYAFEASLNSKVAVEVLAQMIVSTKDHGLSKTQFYEKLMNVSGSQVFSIKYDEDYGFENEERQLIESGVHKRLVDRFLKIYEMKDGLADLKPVVLPVPVGGNVNVVKTARRCWSSSSFFGLSKKGGCYDYKYTVPQWIEGQSFNDIRDFLHIDYNVEEVVSEGKVFNYSLATTFFDLEKAEKNEAKNEVQK